MKACLASLLLLTIGALLVMLNLVVRRFIPVWLATCDEADNIVSAQWSTIEAYIFNLLSSIGLVLCAISFIALSYRNSHG